ncbi:site-specific integrase [Actinacidiphila bryophytorum]|uniref:site-specific integrase n=1 Tax=Actinacidiphila bryophytorum TaxID=1436133 RepID=UPI002176AF4A|nr:site-specific integrase [Actinacidiphila bryophytorum]UWE11927.1 site-specific integrase [Actinacidiphila bryophytorum]
MATPLPVAPGPRDARTTEVIDALDTAFLDLLSWDWETRVVFYPKAHPVLGMPDCQVSGCDKGTHFSRPLCPGCDNRRRQAGASVEAFVTTTRPRAWRSIGQEMCLVRECQRPRHSVRAGLCNNHQYQRVEMLQLELEEFLAHPSARGLPGFGGCGVASCYRLRHSARIPFCDPHQARLNTAKRRGTFDGDTERWQLTTSAIAVDREVSLRGLPDRLAAELLYVLQVRTMSGAKTHDHQFRVISDWLRVMQASSLHGLNDAELAAGGMTRNIRVITKGGQTALRRLGASPETERLKDVWDLFVFGHGGTLDFTKIHQRPLREAAKVWAYDELPRRRGKSVSHAMQNMLAGLVSLSESLRLQRPDEGHLPGGLGRNDMVSFCNRLAFLAENGKMSQHTRLNHVRYARLITNRVRVLGVTGPGQPLEGLPAAFALSLQDIPDEPEDTEAGRDLPDEVMRQLCDNLDLLEKSSSREVRVAIELLIDTGRRPDEIATLPLDCLTTDTDGSPVLVYDNHKAYRLGRTLPIAKATAAVIITQQERVRERFPDTPPGELKLLPSPVTNPEGKKSITTIGDPHRAWVDSLPDFLISVVVLKDGQPQLQVVPYDKAKVFPYAYRHSFAQRHADAGVAPEVLQTLMDHRELSTTQGYYRVSQERKREAVDRVTALQFDRHGNRVWRKVQGLLESEHVRRAIGEVATAYGVCQEPSNVAAGGHACPLRFRCVGCDHFRTDVSYLPDLERYLADLLQSRERLMSAFEADDWARSEALPSEEEIRRVRRLISRVKADLDDLTPEDRAQIEEAVAVVRRGRTVMLGLPKVRQPLPDVRPWSSS